MANRLVETAAPRRAVPRKAVFCAFLAVPALMTGWMRFGHPLWAVAAGVVLVLTFAVAALSHRRHGLFGPRRGVVELYGGPLDGERLDLSGLSEEQLAAGLTLPVRGGGSSRYAPDAAGVLRHVGDG